MIFNSVTHVAWLLTLLRIIFGAFALYSIITIPSLLSRWHASGVGCLILVGWLLLAALSLPIARGLAGKTTFWVSVVTALVVTRVATLALTYGCIPTGDPMIYVQLAQSIIQGDGLVFSDPMTGTVFLALYPPGFPLFLAMLGTLFGLKMPTVWAVNVVLDIISTMLIARLGSRLGSVSAGRAAAWLFATWPTFILAAPFAQKETLQTPLVLLIGLAVAHLRDGSSPRWRDGMFFGAAAGTLALVQPGLAMLPIALGIAFSPAVGLRPLIALAVRAVPIALAVLAPWWIRNALVLGAFVPLTSTGGLGLWIGNNAHATGNWMALPSEFSRLPELEMSSRAAAAAKLWIVDNPIAFARLTLTKLVRTTGVEQFTLLRFSLLTPGLSASTLAALFPLLQGALFSLLGGLTALTGRVTRAAGGDRIVLLVAGCAIQIGAFGVWFEFAERHRYFMMPFLFLLIGYGFSVAPSIRKPIPPISSIE